MDEKELIAQRLALLEASHFREVLSSYYSACVKLDTHHKLRMPDVEDKGFQVGDTVVGCLDFRRAVFAVDAIPTNTREQLGSMVDYSIFMAAQMHVFWLLEKDQTGEQAPASLHHVISRLGLPENIERINLIRGNAEKTLEVLRAKYERLWEENGKFARKAYRNQLAHGHVSILDADNERYKDLGEQEKNSLHFYAVLDEIFGSLSYISKTCFGVKADLPSRQAYVESFWKGNINTDIWCFDLLTYPKDFPLIDDRKRVIRRGQ